MPYLTIPRDGGVELAVRAYGMTAPSERDRTITRLTATGLVQRDEQFVPEPGHDDRLDLARRWFGP